YFDVNSASPQTKIEAADAVEMAGGRYVEASIMSPISPRRIEAPILLGGPHAQDFEAVAKALGFRNAAFYSQERGKAAAAKLCRSVVVKGIEALISESMLAARHYGVERDVIASLDDLLPHPDWREHARYMISRTLQHGARRAEEMQEAARAIADAGVEPWMANATVMRQAFAGALDLDHHAGDLEVLVDAMRARIASMSREAGVTP
ncbi:MAG TPA: NAD(P)-dependent oxidoreductase, partial [Parvularcula sp.]|nr:NAD(P)-dependent oxidoreductase [Parvularcula sp.]